MTQNVADHLWIRTGVDLPGRVTVTEGVRANHVSVDADSMCVLTDAMTNGTAGEGIVR
jgi:hypothetical protein